MTRLVLHDIDTIFISYDEPNADKNYSELVKILPWAKRIHGIKGSDSAHKAAANLSETDRFVTVDADNIVHQIPKRQSNSDIKISQANYRFDVLIEQDNINREFRIRLSGEIKDQYRQDINSKKYIICYVTAENDPNILYKKLDIPLSKLLQYHYYTIPYDDFKDLSCNIFSLRHFNNYLHLVIE